MKDTNSLSPDAPTGNIGARNCVSPTHRAEPLQPIKPSPSQGGLMGTDSPAELLISRLNGVKQTKPDRWIARCPAHDDRSPSLSISETTDGTLLIRCWAGCGAEEIVNAVGLKLLHLFPRQPSATKTNPRKNRFSAYEVVQTACTEAMILSIAYQQVLSGEQLSREDEKRIAQAIKAITAIHSEVIR